MNSENPLSVIHKGDVANIYEGRPIRVLGIDLGTTNSTVSECSHVVQRKRPDVVQDWSLTSWYAGPRAGLLASVFSQQRQP